MENTLRVALVHDYLREYGGAERVLEELHHMFPDAPVYTAFIDRKSLGIHSARFEGWKLIESRAARIPLITRLYSPLRLFAAYFFESFDLTSFDVVISSTNMYMAKAVLTRPDALHISYIHTPPRSLYGYSTASNWKKNWLVRIVGEILNYRMRQIDFISAQRPDVLVANSQVVKSRIQKYYRRDAIVIYPPVSSTVSRSPRSGEYYLFVGRLVYAKHPEIAVAACERLGLPLKVVGSGPLYESLKRDAGSGVEFLGAVNDEQLDSVYAGAKALLFPVEDEDFGMVPIEAQMHGVPVLAHNSGGVVETIVDGETGVLFDELTPEGLMAAISRMHTISFNSHEISKHAQLFSKERFRTDFSRLINVECTIRSKKEVV